MENSCLNLAHFYGRKADNHLRYRRYDDAIFAHQRAADLLMEAISKTTASKSIESLQLQRNHHIKHKDLVLMKKDHYDKYTRAVAQQKKNKAENIERLARDRIENSCQLQLDIYKTMEDTDSLLEILLTNKSSSGKLNDNSTANVTTTTEAKSDTKLPSDGQQKTKSKDESTAIEELRTLNHQLHMLVFRLVSQLDEVNQESEMLRDKIKVLERSNKSAVVHNVLLPMKHVDIQHNNNGGRQIHNVMIVPAITSKPTVNLDDNEQQLVEHQEYLSCEPLSSSCDIDDDEICGGAAGGGESEIVTADGSDNNSSREESSSELPPLELPTFDFTTFDCKK